MSGPAPGSMVTGIRRSPPGVAMTTLEGALPSRTASRSDAIIRDPAGPCARDISRSAIRCLRVFALVVGLFALGQAERDLRLALEEVELEGNEGAPLALEGADQALDLAAVQQELPGAERLVVPAVPLLVGGDVHPLEPEFALLDQGPGLLDGRLAGPERLDLGSPQHETRLDGFEDEIVVRRLGVAGHRHPRFARS